MKWVPVSVALPVPGVPVLVFVRYGSTCSRRLRAQYSDGRSLPVCDELKGEYGEYDEETDEYWCPEGWYETNEHEEIHWAIDGDVTHWMLLPEPPEEYR